MSTPCPWCGEPYEDPAALCASCMRAPAQHPKLMGRAARALDLDLDRPAPDAAPHSGPRSQPSEGDDASDLGALADWDDAGQLDIALDLGSVPPPARTSAPARPPADRGAASQPGEPPGRAAPPESTQPALSRGPASSSAMKGPISQRGVIDGLPSDELEVRVLADYGREPASILHAPAYAWRVVRRRKELRALQRNQQALHGEVTRALYGKLAQELEAIAQRAEPALLADLLEPVGRADAMLAQRGDALSSARGQLAASFESMSEALVREQERRKAAAKERDVAQIAIEDAAQKRAQVAADKKRLEQTLSVAHDDAAKAAGDGEYAPPEHARRIHKIEAELAKVEAMSSGADQAFEACKRELSARGDALHAIDGDIRAIRRRQQDAERGAAQTEDAGEASVRQAELVRLEAHVAALGRIERELPQLIDEEQRKRVAQIHAQLAEAQADLDRSSRAVDAYAKDAFHQGVGVVAAALVVVLLLLISLARVG